MHAIPCLRLNNNTFMYICPFSFSHCGQPHQNDVWYCVMFDSLAAYTSHVFSMCLFRTRRKNENFSVNTWNRIKCAANGNNGRNGESVYPCSIYRLSFVHIAGSVSCTYTHSHTCYAMRKKRKEEKGLLSHNVVRVKMCLLCTQTDELRRYHCPFDETVMY